MNDELVEGQDTLDEYVPGSTAATLDKLFGMCDGIIVS